MNVPLWSHGVIKSLIWSVALYISNASPLILAQCHSEVAVNFGLFRELADQTGWKEDLSIKKMPSSSTEKELK